MLTFNEIKTLKKGDNLIERDCGLSTHIILLEDAVAGEGEFGPNVRFRCLLPDGRESDHLFTERYMHYGAKLERYFG